MGICARRQVQGAYNFALFEMPKWNLTTLDSVRFEVANMWLPT